MKSWFILRARIALLLPARPSRRHWSPISRILPASKLPHSVFPLLYLSLRCGRVHCGRLLPSTADGPCRVNVPARPAINDAMNAHYQLPTVERLQRLLDLPHRQASFLRKIFVARVSEPGLGAEQVRERPCQGRRGSRGSETRCAASAEARSSDQMPPPM